MKYFFMIITLLSTINWGLAQEKIEHHENIKTKNVILLFAGSTHIVQSGINMPTFGVEYGHRIFNNIAIGGIIEYEAGQHIIMHGGHGEEIDITRSNSLLIIPSVYYIIHHLVVFSVGYGIEIESEENLALLKIGMGLELQLKNPKWIFYPNASWDHTSHYDGIVYGFSIGYGF